MQERSVPPTPERGWLERNNGLIGGILIGAVGAVVATALLIGIPARSRLRTIDENVSQLEEFQKETQATLAELQKLSLESAARLATLEPSILSFEQQVRLFSIDMQVSQKALTKVEEHIKRVEEYARSIEKQKRTPPVVETKGSSQAREKVKGSINKSQPPKRQRR
jgi:septal ring factor EnvC (AmiA/AmiB activator)